MGLEQSSLNSSESTNVPELSGRTGYHGTWSRKRRDGTRGCRRHVRGMFHVSDPGMAAGVVVAVPDKVNRANGEEDEHDLYEAPRELPVGEMASWKH